MSGTTLSTSHGKKSLKDICDLIKVCGESNVTYLELDGLEVHFAPKRGEDQLTMGHFAPNIDMRSNQSPAEDGIPEEDRQELLMITDPLRYEEELVNQE